MKIKKANQLPKERINEFLKSADGIKTEMILESGYILEVNDEISGCFILEKKADKLYELKKFYLISTEAVKIPTLFEAILSLAKERGAQQLLVRSHKLMTDIILESLHFYPQEDIKSSGKWWSYTIPN